MKDTSSGRSSAGALKDTAVVIDGLFSTDDEPAGMFRPEGGTADISESHPSVCHVHNGY
jgi:hypothetical protein